MMRCSSSSVFQLVVVVWCVVLTPLRFLPQVHAFGVVPLPQQRPRSSQLYNNNHNQPPPPPSTEESNHNHHHHHDDDDVAMDIDGKQIAQTIRQELKQQVEEMKVLHEGLTPGLAVLLVGSRRDSQTYVRMKQKACEECGIVSWGYTFEEDISQEDLLTQIEECNVNPHIHGILVQLPLPSHIDESTVVEAIHPEKDVDGLHPLNVAALATTTTHQRNSNNNNNHNDNDTPPTTTTTLPLLDWNQLDQIPFHIPCTPQGCMELLDRSNVPIGGKKAVVIGRSNLVGIPVSLLLLHRDATVTIVHSKTEHPEEIVNSADIVIVAIGRAKAIPGHWFASHATVIDVGINSIEAPPDNNNNNNNTSSKGYKLVGDVNYDEARYIVQKLTPVPGGVGPMTIAMLLRNTVNACRRTLPPLLSSSNTTK